MRPQVYPCDDLSHCGRMMCSNLQTGERSCMTMSVAIQDGTPCDGYGSGGASHQCLTVGYGDTPEEILTDDTPAPVAYGDACVSADELRTYHWYQRPRRSLLRKIHVAAFSTDYPRRSRGVAATRLHGLSRS